MTDRRRIVGKRIGEILIEQGLINKAQLDEGLKWQKEMGGHLGQALIALDFIKEEDLAQVFTVQYGFPYLPLENYEISRKASSFVPENVARHYNLVPVDKIGTVITIAMSNPLNAQAIEDIEMHTKCEAQVFVSTVSDIERAINKLYSAKRL